jgi:CheY-like chemotaxis protein
MRRQSILRWPFPQALTRAGNGREAIELYRIHRPDITLMDLQMPIMRGTDAIAAIRVDFPNACIIVLSTYTFYPEVGIASLELLEHLGVEVEYPFAQTCCGQPMANSGCQGDSRATEEHFVRLFSRFEYVVKQRIGKPETEASRSLSLCRMMSSVVFSCGATKLFMLQTRTMYSQASQ